MSELEDDFNGDTAHLIRSIGALIALNDKGVLVPHGIGGHARGLLSSAAVRLVRLERIAACFDYHGGGFVSCDVCRHESGAIRDILDIYLLTREDRAELGAAEYTAKRGYHFPRKPAAVNPPALSPSQAEQEQLKPNPPIGAGCGVGE